MLNLLQASRARGQCKFSWRGVQGAFYFCRIVRIFTAIHEARNVRTRTYENTHGLSIGGGGILVSRPLYAEHDKNCKNIHGKVTVVTQDGITVDDKLYKIGESTRITKDDKVVTLENLKPG